MPTPTRAVFAAMTLTAVPAAAMAQYEITIDVENPTLRPGESTVVTMYAGFDPDLWALAGVATDLVASTGSVGLSDAMVLAPLHGPGTSPGTPSATGFDDIIAGQLQFHSISADPTNPIGFWEATYTAPLDVTAPFEIDLSTMTTKYDVFLIPDESFSESHLADLVEGSATIHVIPAPASASLLALGVFAAARRRR